MAGFLGLGKKAMRNIGKGWKEDRKEMQETNMSLAERIAELTKQGMSMKEAIRIANKERDEQREI